MKIHDVVQGSPEWLSLCASYYAASEAPAMMGASKHHTRSDLLKRKATGIAEEINQAKQASFDRCHEAARLARPTVEAMIGEKLFPATVTCEVDGLPLLASLNGITKDGTVIWETKLLNASLQDAIAMSELDLYSFYQIEQKLLVTGADKCYFTASDGTEEGTFGMWMESSQEIRAKLIFGWKQFDEDLKNYQHVEVVAEPVADAIEDLPALTVQLVGQVMSSNLATFQSAVITRIQSINTTLVTDADFANADKMVKFLDDSEKRLDLVKAQALAQTESIDKLFRTIDSLKAEMRSKRLTLDKLVKAEKENRKLDIILKAGNELGDYVVALQQRVGVQFKPRVYIFSDVIKGLKSLESVRDRVSTALAHAKIQANEIADLVEFNKGAVEDMSLFPDFIQVCTKPADDFAALLEMRVAQRKESEEKRLADEREKIRAEEQEKVRRQIEAEQAASKQSCVQNLPRYETQPALTATSKTQQASSGATMKLGEICTRLGFTVTADFMAHIGFPFVAHDKNAKLYRASDFQDMCEAIAAHCLKAGNRSQKAA